MRKLAGMAAGVVLMAAGGGPAWAQLASDKPLTALSITEVRALAVETGGVPGEVTELDDGGYSLAIAYPDGLFVDFEGWTCTGEGEARRCTEFQLHANFELESEAEALAMEHEVNIVWLADMAIGNRLKVWRMDYLEGMTRGRMPGVFRTFLETLDAARTIVFADDEAAGASAAD